MINYPNGYNGYISGTYVYPSRLSQTDLADIRTVIAEELAKVEQGECIKVEQGEYIEVEQVQNGKRYMGRLYLVEEEEGEEEA